MPDIVLILLAIVVLYFWLRALNSIRGTTLIAPWCWAVIAVVANVWSGLETGSWNGIYQSSLSVSGYLAAITSFCPTVALLGARRPHHRAWTFVVLALWCVLALPAIKTALLQPNEPVSVQGIFVCFFGLLIIAEILNRLGTWFWIVGLLQASCEILYLAPHLPLPKSAAYEDLWILAVFLQCLSVIVHGFCLARRRRPHNWTTLWLWFRDAFGVLWSLRIAEQLNNTAMQYTPARLSWRGFRATNGFRWADVISGGEKRTAFQQAFVNLLRRFVSDDDIQQAIKNPY